LLTNYLFKYFSGDPAFQDLAGHETRRRAKEVVAAGPLQYCEYYHHCRSIPCVDPRVNLMKFHDRSRRQPSEELAHIIVQVRNPLLSIRSFYAFQHKRAPRDCDDFLEMLRPELAYWSGFVEKWVLTPHPSRLVIRYDDLILDPSVTLARAIRFLQPGRPVDDDLLRRCIGSQRVVRSDWVAQQRSLWADSRLAAVEEQVMPLLERAGIERLFKPSPPAHHAN